LPGPLPESSERPGSPRRDHRRADATGAAAMLLIGLAFVVITALGTSLAGRSASRLAGADDTWSIVSASSLAPAARGIRVEVFGRSIRIEIEPFGGEGTQ